MIVSPLHMFHTVKERSPLLRSCYVACLVGLFAPTFSLAQEEKETTLERIRREGVLRWGADPSGGAPFAFVNPYNLDEVTGFEVELIERLARHLKVRPELVRVDWPALPSSLEAKRIDLAFNGMEITDKRAQEVQYTIPYFRYRQQLVVRKADQERFRTLDDLKGRKVAVLNGSAAVDVLEEHGWVKEQILELDDSLKPMQAVKQERADACLCEGIIAVYYADKDRELYIVPDTFSPGHYGGVVRKGDTDLLDELNRVLKKMKESGELGELYQRWGIWDDGLSRELGMEKGKDQPLSELARRSYELNWTRAVLLGKALLKGTSYTLLLTVVSMPLALALGLVLALMAMSRRWWVRWPANVYIQVIRGTPLLVQIFVIFFSLPELGRLLGLGSLLTWDPIFVGILCLSVNYAAYEAEIHRAGIQAVPKGQREAALALGMSERQAFFSVVLPQSFRIILPPVLNDLISMLKDSCLVSVMGVGELLYVAGNIGKSTFLYGEMLLAAAVIYLVLSLLADRIGKTVEARLRRRGFNVVSQAALR